MSELSGLLVRSGYHVSREVSTDSVTTGIWFSKVEINCTINFNTSHSLGLTISERPNTEQILAELREICTQFMKAGPICRYDANPSQWAHFMEWELKYPRGRLRMLVNRPTELIRMPFYNLQLFGDYQISEFRDETLRQAYLKLATLHKKYPGIFGKDPGELELARVINGSEFELFLEYVRLEKLLIGQEDYRGTARTSDDLQAIIQTGMTLDEFELLNTLLALDFVAATICEKVGIDILEEPSNEYRLCFDKDEFGAWYSFYDAYLTVACPDNEQLLELMEAYQYGEDVSAYAPKRNWRKT